VFSSFVFDEDATGCKVSKAFTLKLGHLYDIIKPACSTEKIRYNVDQMNKPWVCGRTRILIYHYESSVGDFVIKISYLRMNPFQIQHFINKTLEKGLKRYRKKLNNNTIREFKNLLMKGHRTRRNFKHCRLGPNKWKVNLQKFRIGRKLKPRSGKLSIRGINLAISFSVGLILEDIILSL